jgi:Tol biopolymer transport system component
MSGITFLPIARSLAFLALLCVAASACASQTPAPTTLPSPEVTVTVSMPPAATQAATPSLSIATSTSAHLPTPPPEVTLTTSAPPAATQAATTPLPTASSASIPLSTSLRCPVVLFARESDLWRTNLDGEAVEQLTQGERLIWQPGKDNWWANFLSTPVQVSPDGQWITFLGQRVRILVDVTTRTQIGLPMPHAAIGDWSPDSRYFAYAPEPIGSHQVLYSYDIQQGQTTRLLDLPIDDREAGGGIRNVVWSPDGRFIGFACCFTIPTDVYTGTLVGQIRQIEVATGQMETVGETQSSVAASSHLCWTADGHLTADKSQGIRCSYERSRYPAVSGDGSKYASLGPSSPDDSSWTRPSRLTVSEAAMGEVLWQREISGTLKTVTWSPDSQYLLLDDDLDRSPIWHIRSDGSAELEPIIEDGFLLGVIPQWCQTPAGSHILSFRRAMSSVAGLGRNVREPRFCWSADGKHLVYLADGQLRVADAPDFTDTFALADVGGASQVLCSPDGHNVALVRARQDGAGFHETVVVVGEDGAIRDLLPGEAADMSVSDIKTLLTWSDDQWIFFTNHRGTGVNDLVAVHADTGQVQYIVNYPSGLITDTMGAAYYWSPTRAFLAMEEAGSGVPKVTVIGLSTKRQIRLCELPGMPQYQAVEGWSPDLDEQMLLFEGWSDDPRGFPHVVPNLMTWDAHKGTQQCLIPHACHSVWSPGGVYIAFILVGAPIYDGQGQLMDTNVATPPTDHLEVGILDVETGHIVDLIPVSLDQTQTIHDPRCLTNILLWSPDDTRLAYSTGQGELWLYSMDTGMSQQLMSRGEAYQAIWSPDGIRIAVGTPENILVLEPN